MKTCVRALLLLSLALAITAPLAACGRKGQLENPPGGATGNYPKPYPTE